MSRAILFYCYNFIWCVVRYSDSLQWLLPLLVFLVSGVATPPKATTYTYHCNALTTSSLLYIWLTDSCCNGIFHHRQSAGLDEFTLQPTNLYPRWSNTVPHSTCCSSIQHICFKAMQGIMTFTVCKSPRASSKLLRQVTCT